MTDTSSSEKKRQDDANWTGPISSLQVSRVPTGALNLNVDGRQVVGPLQGFGSLWQKTFRLSLPDIALTPAEIMQIWKTNFPRFQPAQNRFFPVAALEPGQIVLINASSSGMLLSTGVIVLYADEESFTLMTPQGHPESGWVTFSTFREEGCTICQVQTMSRATDPLYELFFRMFASHSQDRIWTHVLEALGSHLHTLESSTASPELQTKPEQKTGKLTIQVQSSKICLDPGVQWSEAKNIWENAALRTIFYSLNTPIRWLLQRLKHTKVSRESVEHEAQVHGIDHTHQPAVDEHDRPLQ